MREDVELGMLPRAVWIAISQFNGVTECCSMMKCCQWLEASFKVQAIWHHQALHSGYCSAEVQPETNWVCDTAPKASLLIQSIDWRMLVCLNVAFPPRQFVSIRIGSFDLCLPLSASPEASFGELGSWLTQILAPLVEAPESPKPASQERTWPMRLRWLQWCGRPGLLAEGHGLPTVPPTDSSLAKRSLRPASKLLLEWADPFDNSWPLPPCQDWHLDFQGHRNSGQIAWDWHEGGRQASSSSPHGNGLSQEEMLVCLKSSLLKKERWLLLEEPSLWELLQKIRATLTFEDKGLCDRPVRFRLMDMLQPADVEHPTLKQLAWAQSEMVYVEEMVPSSKGAAPCSPKEVVFSLRRDQAFSHLRRSVCGEDELDDGCAQTGGWSRTVTEPALQAASNAAMPEPEEFDIVTMRQFSAPTPQAGYPPRDGAANPDVSGDSEAKPMGSVTERIVPHYPPTLVPGTQRTRQFEFHPLLKDIILIGDKLGAAQIVSADGAPESEEHPALQVDACPLLSLSWTRHNPSVAVCGAANTGGICFLRYTPDARPGEQLLKLSNRVKSFPKLSSLSINCSDDFLLASGISSNIAIYDVETGNVVCNGGRVHEHFINISRFCQTSPHIFATASFDHTCKIWDLRQPLTGNRAVKTLNTEGHNVMCQFSPDDRHFLCSGIDTQLVQFEVSSWQQMPLQMPLRPSVHQDRYRRSAYLASGQHFLTAATEESHVHVMSTQGEKLGVIDFRRTFEEFSAPELSVRQKLISGTVALDDAEPMSGSSRKNHAFVQSIRAHPVISNRLGVLMAKTKGQALQPASESYIAVLDLDQREMAR
eukprot:CAMPEP_0197620652 /NCGR_PEP_ID=MMETSP1338-20131121/1448_1 /TAXON_ID=43686 ORGANISM="Pelagodinium beii, Strain RCC1491" /NCGR_SAMPLE_ID=MMETSP1338 /ASSEMBLY_ACC=CAM_ASM_000754 /LENGTH=819 /DNA_ID=CAMNT_0043189899 /DNA_START=128 /DNA_END=2587 /DNA_ORIENTATION=+